MKARILSAGVSAVLLITSSNLIAADNNNQNQTQADQEQMKKHCQDMMKDMDMSKMTPAQHEEMMKKCKDMHKQDKKKSQGSSNY